MFGLKLTLLITPPILHAGGAMGYKWYFKSCTPRIPAPIAQLVEHSTVEVSIIDIEMSSVQIRLFGIVESLFIL